jgi:hypothetical protein
MKRRIIIGCVMVGLWLSGAATTLLAQNGPGPGAKGGGYGGPPKTQAERIARQQACPLPGVQCPGVCPIGCPGRQGKGAGLGPRNGAGYGYRRGLRDGTGPRSVNGTCPLLSPSSTPAK